MSTETSDQLLQALTDFMRAEHAESLASAEADLARAIADGDERWRRIYQYKVDYFHSTVGYWEGKRPEHPLPPIEVAMRGSGR